ncbi:MAG: hypothetical protein Fur003_5910 [Candidatus Dojkabacteria bacterium]
MVHIAIMNKRLGFIPKIVSGEKQIESRWYKAKYAPWDRIKAGETIYFKNSGEKVSAKAIVSKVLQIADLNRPIVERLLKEYGAKIGFSSVEYSSYYVGRKYCILLFLKEAQWVTPFSIDKSGFGSAAAWLCVEDLERIKI